METTVILPTYFPYTHTKFGSFPKEDTALAEGRLHEHTVVSLLAVYGSDTLIAETARVSYGKGTTQRRDVRALLRYLVRHRHTSPLEHAEVVFYLKIPIFVARQLIRHRTANVNEYSARYSELSTEYFVPSAASLAHQSTSNRQGRDGAFDPHDANEICHEMDRVQREGHESYQTLLRHYDVTRELARIVTPVGTYTEMYWKCDLHNFLHFLKLRMDAHAQQEIRDIATTMYQCARPFFPHVMDAWNDYVRNSYTLSAAELQVLRAVFQKAGVNDGHLPDSGLFPDMTAREWSDCANFISSLRTVVD